MLTNPCLCIFGGGICVLYFINQDYKRFSLRVLKQLFAWPKFGEQIFNTFLKQNIAYVLLLKMM